MFKLVILKNYSFLFILLIYFCGCYKPILPEEPIFDNPYDIDSPMFADSLIYGKWEILNWYKTTLFNQNGVSIDNEIILIGGINLEYSLTSAYDTVILINKEKITDSLIIYGYKSMENGRIEATLIFDGIYVYIFGGDTIGSVYRFSPSYIKENWFRLGNLPSNKMYFGTFGVLDTLSYQPRIIIGGGYSLSIELSDELWEYFPKTNKWSLMAKMPMKLRNSTAQILNNKLFIIGGFDSLGLPSSKIFTYDFKNKQWNIFPDTLSYARGNLCSFINNNRIYVCGGKNQLGIYLNNVDEINVTKYKCYPKSPLPQNFVPYFSGEIDNVPIIIGGQNAINLIIKFKYPY